MAGSRAACPNEVCTCGRPAVKVFVGPSGQEVGYCGINDGGERSGRCPFWGYQRHPGPCPKYRLNAPEGWSIND